MELQGITILPNNPNFNERLERDLILEAISKRPEVIVIVSPEGHIFVDAISIDYFTKLTIDKKEYSCDMGLLDDLNRIMIREKIPAIFINPEKKEEFQLSGQVSKSEENFLNLLNRVLPEFKLVQINPGSIDKGDLLETGRSIRECIERNGHKAVIVVFSNLIENSDFRDLFNASLGSNDFLPVLNYTPTPNEEDSYNSLLIGIGATEKLKINYQVKEGDNEVGYFLSFLVNELDLKDKDKVNEVEFTVPSVIEAWNNVRKEQREALLKAETILQKMVRATVELWVNDRRTLNFDTYAQENIENEEIIERLKNQRTGVFVTILKNGQYRGTMGTVNPVTKNIAQEIINNTIEAAGYDPQFVPVGAEEIPDLSFEVNVLNPLESVESEDELDPEKYGIVVEQGLKRGVVLPGIEEIKTVEEQLSLAKERAGIDETDTWDPLLINKFTVETF